MTETEIVLFAAAGATIILLVIVSTSFAAGWYLARRRYKPKPDAPATNRQRAFLTRLASERPGARALLIDLDVEPDDPQLTATTASRAIDALKTLPRRRRIR